MKIKKEEDIKEEGIEKEKIKKEEEEEEEEEEGVLDSSFRASLSRFAYPSSPPSSTRRQPPLKRSSPDSNPNNDHTSPSVSLTLTVAVAQSQSTPPVVTVQHGNNNDESVQTLLLRRSPRKRKGGENHQCLDTGGGGGGDGGGAGTRPSKKMRRGGRRAPEVDLSHLPHLGALPEYLAEDLDVLFCGINPGRTSATSGHHYANGTNHFWPCLHLSGFTPRQLSANEDSTLPEMYNLGLTNLVERASISEIQLLKREMANSVPALLAKVARWRPRVICFNGKGIWLHVERSLQQQLVQSDGSDDSAATGSRVVVPKKENEEKPIIGQERPVKTEWATTRSLQQPPPPLKKDTSNDGVATKSEMMALKREAEEYKPRIVDTDQERPSKTKRERSGSGASSTTANSSSLDAGRFLRPSNSTSVTMPDGSENAVASPSNPVAPRRAATASQSTFVYGIQPYKTVHDVVPENATVRETLFCVFPSSSGRVVSRQRNDKVVLFKKLRENLELIQAGTFDTSSMQLVRLDRQGT